MQIKSRGIFLVSCTLFLLGRVSFAQQTAPTPPPSALDVEALMIERLRNLPPAEKKEFCESLLGMKLLPECWKTASKEAVIGNINLMGEPLPAEAVDAVERVFPSLSEHRVKIVAATLLYRYDRPLGKTYLLQQTNDFLDSDAAQVLALNQEDAAVSGIVKTLLRYRHGELAIAVASWKRPEIRAALVTAFNTALKNKEQGYGNFFIPLAQQEASEAIPALRRCSQEITLGESDAKLDAIAALIRLRVPERKQLAQYLVDLLLKDTPSASKYAIIEVMGKTEEPSFVKPLESMIRQYVDKQGAESLGEDAAQLSVSAAQALAEMKSVKSHPLLERLMEILKTRNSPFLGDTVARALLDIAGPNSADVIKNTMGAEWLAKEQELRKLKKAPIHLLPQRGKLLPH